MHEWKAALAVSIVTCGSKCVHTNENMHMHGGVHDSVYVYSCTVNQSINQPIDSISYAGGCTYNNYDRYTLYIVQLCTVVLYTNKSGKPPTYTYTHFPSFYAAKSKLVHTTCEGRAAQ